MKNSVKAQDKNGSGVKSFQIEISFLKSRDGKLKEGIFVDPQMKRPLMESTFDDKLNECEPG